MVDGGDPGTPNPVLGELQPIKLSIGNSPLPSLVHVAGQTAETQEDHQG